MSLLLWSCDLWSATQHHRSIVRDAEQWTVVEFVPVVSARSEGDAHLQVPGLVVRQRQLVIRVQVIEASVEGHSVVQWDVQLGTKNRVLLVASTSQQFKITRVAELDSVEQSVSVDRLPRDAWQKCPTNKSAVILNIVGPTETKVVSTSEHPAKFCTDLYDVQCRHELFVQDVSNGTELKTVVDSSEQTGGDERLLPIASSEYAIFQVRVNEVDTNLT